MQAPRFRGRHSDGVAGEREFEEAILVKFLGQAQPGRRGIPGHALRPDRSQRLTEELLQGGSIPQMLDRPIGFHDEEILRGERHGWHLGDRVLAEAHRVERVSAERARRGVVRDRNHLPALRALELGQFFFHRLKPCLIRRRGGRAGCQQGQTKGTDCVGRHVSPHCSRSAPPEPRPWNASHWE